ncbi:MAG TPA: hypothetical protein VME66_14105 [Candidatus Acidoferrales bacterium]|nr:hypothetical protein [Candidatus Acidoferrales bacterium]
MNVLRIISIARSSLPRVIPLMRNRRVPTWLKGATIVAGLLVVSPLDIFGDIPILGLLDDFTLLALLTTLFVNIASALLRRQDAGESMRVVGPVSLPPSGSAS